MTLSLIHESAFQLLYAYFCRFSEVIRTHECDRAMDNDDTQCRPLGFQRTAVSLNIGERHDTDPKGDSKAK